jgi:hypothetical protein
MFGDDDDDDDDDDEEEEEEEEEEEDNKQVNVNTSFSDSKVGGKRKIITHISTVNKKGKLYNQPYYDGKKLSISKEYNRRSGSGSVNIYRSDSDSSTYKFSVHSSEKIQNTKYITNQGFYIAETFDIKHVDYFNVRLNRIFEEKNINSKNNKFKCNTQAEFHIIRKIMMDIGNKL